MNTYHPEIQFKTKLINVLRLIFTAPVFEKLLVTHLLKHPDSLLYKLVPPNYLYKKYSPRNVTRNGINCKLDISKVVDHDIYYGYKKNMYASVQDDLKNAQVILDIGANILNSSLYYAYTNPGAKIWAFEPHPGTYKIADENLHLNQFTNIHLLNMGLVSKSKP